MKTKQFKSKCRLRIVFPKPVKLVVYGIENPVHELNYNSIRFFFERFIEADFKKYFF